MEDNNELRSETLMQDYNIATGSTSLDLSSNPSNESAIHWDRFNNLDNNEIEMSDEEIEKLFKESNILGMNTPASLADMSKMMELAQKRMKGEKFSAWKELPQSFKDFINSQLAREGAVIDSSSRSNAANAMISMLCDSYKESNYNMDIEAMLGEFSAKSADIYEKMDKDYGNIMVDITNDIFTRIDEAIAKAKEAGNENTLDKLFEMKDAVDDAFHLTKFKEFCKTVRIKKFDLEKPKKYYEAFNFKYLNHKNTINDISYCANVLSMHNNYGIKKNTALIIAFCKYCNNKKPDNFADHTFMYYFIRNIYTLDKINHLGERYELIRPESKPFYDQITAALNECMDNIRI